MNPGELNRRIKIKRRSGQAITDSDGITREILEDIASLWAAIEPIERQNYYLKVDEIRQLADTRIRVRYNKMLNSLMIVECSDGKRYDICMITDVKDKHDEMHLMCGPLIDLDKICRVLRPVITKNELNRPQQKTLSPIATYPCTFLRKAAEYKQNSPNAEIDLDYFLYGEAVMAINPGDLIEVDGIKYIASMPYKPKNHHTEIEITVKKDV